MNVRRKLVVGVAASLLWLAARLSAQPRMKRIGVLWIKSDTQTNRYLDDLRAALRALGYADGRDISLDDRFLVDRYSLIADAAARLVAEKVDVIVCFGGTAASALSKATRPFRSS